MANDKKRKTMYQINLQQRELINQIEDLDGEITDDTMKQLEINEKDLKQKSVAYLEVIEDKVAKMKRIDTEIDRLQRMKKREQKSVDFLTGMLLFAVKTFGEFTVGLKTFGMSTSKSVNILDEEAVDKKYKTTTTKTTTVISKKLIGADLKEGIKVEGAQYSENHKLKIK